MNPASLANLKPFKPGQSGNTHGRPNAYHTVLRLARANTPDAIRLLVQCMNDAEAPYPARVAAANSLLDRAWGKPKEHLQDDGEKVTSLTIVIERGEQSAPEPAAPQLVPPAVITINAPPAGSSDG